MAEEQQQNNQQGQEQQQQQQAERPGWMPEKFWTGDLTESSQKMAESYSQLQSKLSKPKDQDNPLRIQQSTVDDNTGLDQILDRAGLKADDLSQQFQQSGKLTNEQYAALRKANPGLTRALIDTHLQTTAMAAQFQQQQQQQILTKATELAGGEQQLQTLLGWATNLSPERQQDLNRRLANPALAEGAVRELLAEHQQAVGAGNAQPLVESNQAASGDPVKPFASNREMQEMRHDERYYTDPNYKKLYERRLAKTDDSVFARHATPVEL